MSQLLLPREFSLLFLRVSHLIFQLVSSHLLLGLHVKLLAREPPLWLLTMANVVKASPSLLSPWYLLHPPLLEEGVQLIRRIGGVKPPAPPLLEAPSGFIGCSCSRLISCFGVDGWRYSVLA
jgi:hypothetical protein